MIPHGTKVYFALEPTDMRRSFDGLATVARSKLHQEPSAGGLFVFLNRRGNQVRILFRDRDAWCLVAKRLDRGTFRRPRCEEGRFVWETEAQTLLRFLDDIDFGHCVAQVRRSVAPHLSLLRDPVS